MNGIITGATKGIGRAIAETFAQQGFQLALCARSTEDLINLKAELESKYATKILIFPADLSHKQQVLQFADFVKQHWQQAQILINNAGLFIPGALLTEPDDHLEKMLNLNLFSAYHLTRALLPLMLHQNQNHIFNICSVASQQVYRDTGSYSITKFALLGFSKSLRLELKDQGIKVTALLPGATFTDSWAGTDLPPQRLMEAREVAKAVWSAWDMGPTAVVEEIVMRPQLGDL